MDSATSFKEGEYACKETRINARREETKERKSHVRFQQ